MARRHSSRFRHSFVAILFGLYALCMPGGAHASVVERCVVRQADPVAFDTNAVAPAHLRQVSHRHTIQALPRVSSPTTLLKTACIVASDSAETILVRENVLALGGAPRAPGPSRAPPTA